MRRWRPLTTVLLAAVVAVSAASPARAADHGIQLLSSQQLDSRLTELTLPTPALRAPTHVRVPLPTILSTLRAPAWTELGVAPASPKATVGELPMNRSWTGGMTLPNELADQPVNS